MPHAGANINTAPVFGESARLLAAVLFGRHAAPPSQLRASPPRDMRTRYGSGRRKGADLTLSETRTGRHYTGIRRRERSTPRRRADILVPSAARGDVPPRGLLLRLRRVEAATKQPREEIAAAKAAVGHRQRFAANGVVLARDRNVGDLALVALEDRQQRLVAAIDVLAELELASLRRRTPSDRSDGPGGIAETGCPASLLPNILRMRSSV